MTETSSELIASILVSNADRSAIWVGIPVKEADKMAAVYSPSLGL